jgi:hypothetical protein
MAPHFRAAYFLSLRHDIALHSGDEAATSEYIQFSGCLVKNNNVSGEQSATGA